MPNATSFPTQNVSRSKKSVKRSIEGRTEDVTIDGGATFTAVFERIATALKGILIPRRPNRCRPIHQDYNGFSSQQEKAGWDAASDEAWESIDEAE